MSSVKDRFKNWRNITPKEVLYHPPPRPLHRPPTPQPRPGREFMGCKSCFSTSMETAGKHFHGPDSIQRVKYQGTQLSSRTQGLWSQPTCPATVNHLRFTMTGLYLSSQKRRFLSNFFGCLEGLSFFYKGIVYEEWVHSLRSSVGPRLLLTW